MLSSIIKGKKLTNNLPLNSQDPKHWLKLYLNKIYIYIHIKNKVKSIQIRQLSDFTLQVTELFVQSLETCSSTACQGSQPYWNQ